MLSQVECAACKFKCFGTLSCLQVRPLGALLPGNSHACWTCHCWVVCWTDSRALQAFCCRHCAAQTLVAQRAGSSGELALHAICDCALLPLKAGRALPLQPLQQAHSEQAEG